MSTNSASVLVSGYWQNCQFLLMYTASHPWYDFRCQRYKKELIYSRRRNTGSLQKEMVPWIRSRSGTVGPNEEAQLVMQMGNTRVETAHAAKVICGQYLT